MITTYYLLMLLLSILTMISTFLWASLSVKIHSITYTKICIKNFKNNVDFSRIVFFQKDCKFYYFYMFYFAEIGNFLLLIGFSIFCVFIWRNIWYIFGFIICWFLSHFFCYILIKKLLKQMKLISWNTTKKSIELFKNFLKNNIDKNKQEKIKFILIKNGQKAKRDFPFQWNQKRCQKKLQKILDKNLNEDYKILKMLRIFIWYLKVYAVFLNTLQMENHEYNIKINNQFENLDKLNNILVNNFLSNIQLK